MSGMNLSEFNLDRNKKVLKRSRKSGRPSAKKEGMKYVKITLEIPEEAKRKIAMSLVDKFYGKYKTQSEVINAALEKFLKDV